jgi:hypothetical protein
MTFPADPRQRSPKGDHNRRLSLGLGPAEFAAVAGVTEDQLRAYEYTDVDGSFDVKVAEHVGLALERLEAVIDPRVENGDVPRSGSIEGQVSEALQSPAITTKLALSDPGFAEQLVSSELARIDPTLRLVSFGERARGQLREILVTWKASEDGEDHTEVVALPLQVIHT